MSGEGGPRHPGRSLEGLLKFCLQATRTEDPTSSSEFRDMDPERQEWLIQVLNSMSVSVMEEMLKCLKELKEGTDAVAAGTASEETYSSLETALETLMEHIGSMDNANDFHKIGGFEVLKPLLLTDNTVVQAKAAELIAELVQNNPYCQNMALEFELLPTLLQILDSNHDATLCVKALYALSCLCRQNSEVQKQLETEDGFSILLRAMQRPVEKLRVKAAFLLTSLCNQQPTFREVLYKMGFVEQLAALIQAEHDSSQEHLLSALLALVSQHDPAREECCRPELRMREVLEERIKALEGKEEYREEQDYCLQLLKICFDNSQLQEMER